MRLFPDRETLKRFMKKWLPVAFSAAWSPLVWMLATVVTGPLSRFMGMPWQLAVGINALVTVVVTALLARLFIRYGMKLVESGDE